MEREETNFSKIENAGICATEGNSGVVCQKIYLCW